MSRFLHLATILSLAACEHAAPPPHAPPPASPPTPEVVKVAPSSEITPAVAVPEPEPTPCLRMTRAGTCWSEKQKQRVTKKPAPTANP